MTKERISARLPRLIFTVLVSVALGYILVVRFDIQDLIGQLDALEYRFQYDFLIATICLIVFNWGIESLKWQKAMQPYHPLSYKTAVQSVLVGVAAGIVTPARLGEYAGRMYMIPVEQRAASTVATLLCSITQLIVTMAIGVIAVLQLTYHLDLLAIDTKLIYIYSAISILVLIMVCVFLNDIVRLCRNLPFLRKYLEGLSHYQLDKPLLLKLILLAGLRYLVYGLQYLCILYFLGVEADMFSLTRCIAVIFLIQTLLPLPPMVSFVGRNGIALMVFSILAIPELYILYATTTLWILNILIPTLFGLSVVMLHRRQALDV